MTDVSLSRGNTPSPAKVSRVVPGRLVYVETKSSEPKVFAFTPNVLAIEQSDGSYKRYRGESFAEIGLKVGADVTVTRDDRNSPAVLVRNPGRTPHLGRLLLSKLGLAASR